MLRGVMDLYEDYIIIFSRYRLYSAIHKFGWFLFGNEQGCIRNSNYTYKVNKNKSKYIMWKEEI